MLESKLWHSKTVTKNAKGAKMMGFVKSKISTLKILILDTF